jgi:hypothetical protein
MEDDIDQMCSVNITDQNHPALEKGSATDDLCVTLSFLCNQSHPADQPQQVFSKEYKPHELINFIDTKAKCRHLKKLTCKWNMRRVFFRVYKLETQ